MNKNENNVEENLNPLEKVKYQAGAVDMKVVALTGLLLQKGIITEKEIHQSYIDVIEAVKKHGEKTGHREKEFEAFLIDFLQVNKPLSK